MKHKILRANPLLAREKHEGTTAQPYISTVGLSRWKGDQDNGSKLERELPVHIKEPMRLSSATAPISSLPPRLSLQPLRTQVDQDHSQEKTIQERLEDLRIRLAAS